MNNGYDKWNKSTHHRKGRSDDNSSDKIVISEEFKKTILKYNIDTTKWYHKLLTGQYYRKDMSVYEDTILKRLSAEYQRALHMRLVDALVLIKGELMNYLPEESWIHKYLSGEVCDKNGTPLNQSSKDVEKLSEEYMKIYEKSRELLTS